MQTLFDILILLLLRPPAPSPNYAGEPDPGDPYDPFCCTGG
jgi:hypothetical protein